MEDDEWKKLSLEDRCIHKLWKARVNGYEEATKLFQQLDDEKSPEYAKYLGLIKKFVADSNAMGQEKGLEAALAYVENYANAGKTVGEVMSGVVSKCMAAPKTKTRELALQITLMYVEIEKGEAVQDELIKGMDQKNPKIVAACVNAVTAALREFGSKVVNVKPLVKKMPVLFGERDKGIRDEARLMVVELFRWIGPALRSQLGTLQPVQITELEGEFSKLEGQKVTPTRYIRSQQERQARLASQIEEAEDEDAEDDAPDHPQEIDPYELSDPIDVLSKLPKNFFEQLEAKKWQERKEALENLENLVKAPKLENGDYGDLVRALRKIIVKDSNVVVVALAAKCLTGLGNGLKKRFQQYATFCVSVLLEKFKEKKQNVVAAIREAIDVAYLSLTIESILEDVTEALNNKNPSVKAETALFLARAFCKTSPAALNKKTLKAYTTALIKNINEPDPFVRDCSSEALGTLMKLVGEKAIGLFLADLEKDNLKMTKIKESCEKAVITVKVANVKKEKVVAASPKKIVTGKGKVAGKAENGQVKSSRPGTATTNSTKKKPTIFSGTATIVKSKSGKSINEKPKEKELSDSEAFEAVTVLIKPETLTGLVDKYWKTRQAAAEEFYNEIKELDSNTLPTQALVRIITKSPGLKDTNFQVLKVRLDAIKYLTENSTFSMTSADLCVNDIADKLGDPKNSVLAGETLMAISEATKFDYVAGMVIDYAFSQKNPKVIQEGLLWVSNGLKEFGFLNLNAKHLIDNTKKGLASSNASVRTSAITLLGTLYLYMGPTLNAFFENEKPALRDQINAEFEKYENEKPPLPTRGLNRRANTPDPLNNESTEETVEPPETINIQDLLPRVDLSPQITEALLEEIVDKNWKVRNEALTKVSAIISEAKLIKPNIGNLPQALAPRLVDSNVKIAQTALNICENIANAMGPPCKQYVRVFLPGFLQGLGDSKTWIRSASVTCLNLWGELCNYKEFFEGEMIGDALKTGSPILRSELWMWLAEKLPNLKSVPKDELLVCIPHLYANLEDRNADVRKNAQEAVLGVMIHLGYEAMVKQTEKVKPASKNLIMAALDKARPNLPVKPLPKAKQAPSEDKVVKGTKPVATSKNAVKPKGGTALPKPSSARKKEDEIDTSPLMTVNNLKHQRTIDENKLKVLKWNFTTPREEFVDLLREQMYAANVNKTLIANMFHADFRFHIKAIDSLMDDLAENAPALISNLDLILKWLTLRFFDTNPSVLLRGLEYLHSVFSVLIEVKYSMPENEGAAFLPYLVIKAGDPKDAVRNGVRLLFKQIALVFSVSRLFFYVMEGLKSKNARQRTECLEIMGSLIENYGLNVCLPSPAVCLKEVAKQISDRDNAVRNAALNCIVQAYFITGEKVFKMVGQISGKDMSLLEERIKRAKRPSPGGNRIEQLPISINNSNSCDNMLPLHGENNNMSNHDDDEIEEDDIPGVLLPTPLYHETTNTTESQGPFKLDPTIINALDNINTEIQRPNLQEFDLDFLNETVEIPSLTDARAKAMPMSPPVAFSPNKTFTKANLNDFITSPRIMKDLTLEKTIAAMGSPDVATSFKALEQMQEILQSNKSSSITDYEDDFMSAIVNQLKNLSNEDPKTNGPACKLYRSLLTVIDNFYANQRLGSNISVYVLQDLISQLVGLLAEAKLESCTNGDAYSRVLNLHCVKIIERSDHTKIICALVKLLYDCVSKEGSPRLTDLIMKCLWRVIKLMPAWADDLDYDSILLEIHLFLKDYPTSWWKNKPSDTQLRTIKTIVHSLAKMKGGQLMLHLNKIPYSNDSELETYLLRLLKTLKVEEVKLVPLKSEKTEPRKSFSHSIHRMLTDIFQKIGTKADSKEGFNLLFDFMRQHPEADIDQFLVKSSHVFQDYVSDGLKNVEIARKNTEGVENKSLPSGDASTVANGDYKGPGYWKERLQMWNQLWSNSSSNIVNE